MVVLNGCLVCVGWWLVFFEVILKNCGWFWLVWVLLDVYSNGWLD